MVFKYFMLICNQTIYPLIYLCVFIWNRRCYKNEANRNEYKR